MNEAIRYEVKSASGGTAFAGVKEAISGLRLIGKELSREGWAPLSNNTSDIEFTRAQQVDIGINGKLGDHPQILRFSEPVSNEVWNSLEAALQYSEALLRKKPAYDASLALSRGKIILIANTEGVAKIQSAIAKAIPETEIHISTPPGRSL